MRIRVAATVVVLTQLLAALAAIPVPTGALPSEIGTVTTFANGNSMQEFTFWERGEDTSLSFRLPAN
ncbi:MAG: hypothetical protein FJ149_08795, partial [Euryarchaeota archaeon]|nr:hypothetical protein [Euryarchaeota archaeon]